MVILNNDKKYHNKNISKRFLKTVPEGDSKYSDACWASNASCFLKHATSAMVTTAHSKVKIWVPNFQQEINQVGISSKKDQACQKSWDNIEKVRSSLNHCT